MGFLAASDLSQFGFLVDIGMVIGVGVVASLVMAALRLPFVTGLLLAGAVCGPFGLKLVQDQEVINLLAEVGVVLLLFTIGLEFPLSRFIRIGKPLLIGGSMQVGLTAAATAGINLAFGLPLPTAIAIGLAISLSSTAIVLRGLGDRGEMDAPHGRFIVGTLLFQDLCVIPMMLALPVLAGAGTPGELALEAGKSLGLAAIAVVATYAVARLVLPALLSRVDQTRSREVFIMAIVGICFGIALATGAAGLSLALGAFLAGIVIADSPFATRALTDVLPLRDLLTSLFFISLGMLFDIMALIERPLLVLGIFALIFFGKGFLATVAAMVMRFPARAAVIAGLGLAQFGEFGFVIMNTAKQPELALIDMDAEGRWLSAAGIMTMFITPLMLRFSPHLAAGARLLRPLEKLMGVRSVDQPTKSDSQLENHVVIAGYGVGGRMVASALKAVEVPYVVLEMNAESVRRARAQKEPVYYADVTSTEALDHARIHHASAFVLTINDPSAVERTLYAVRREAPELPIIVRARYAAERAHLVKLGATEVVASELESAVEIMARVLRLLDTPRNVIDREIALVRDRTQTSARVPTVPRRRLAELGDLGHLKVEAYLIDSEDFCEGHSLAQMDLRGRTGATVIAVSRDDEIFNNPDPDMPLKRGDLVYLLGSLQQVRDAMLCLDTGRVPGNGADSDSSVTKASDASSRNR